MDREKKPDATSEECFNYPPLSVPLFFDPSRLRLASSAPLAFRADLRRYQWTPYSRLNHPTINLACLNQRLISDDESAALGSARLRGVFTWKLERRGFFPLFFFFFFFYVRRIDRNRPFDLACSCRHDRDFVKRGNAYRCVLGK